MNNNSGLTALREAAARRLKHGPPSAKILAEALGVGLNALTEFGYGRGTFSSEVLNVMAADLFGPRCSYDAARDLLVRTKSEATPLGVAPAPFVYTGPPMPSYPRDDLAPKPVKPEKAKLPPPKLGWAVW